ncbi:actin-binding protein IPP-like [Drosophila miranda]|uniref:actin-binding protein IPP-like n=1 Tax=Drosophila miranda TaxID=7229 RepID=UPI0007E6B97C|nr:actin-binding protein IPP-like [Drosophila miranda]
MDSKSKVTNDGPEGTEVPYSQTSKSLLAEKLGKNLLGDNVQIIIGETILRCNQTVLVAYCEFFAKTLMIGDTVRLSISLSPSTFELAYTWMINKDPLCPSDEIVPLLVAGLILGCPRLSKGILEAFNDLHSFSAKEAYCCYREAMEMDVAGLAQLLLPRVSQSFLVLVASSVFRKLDAKHVYELLSSNHLAVQSEIEVFYAAIIWLYDDYPNRKKHIKYLLRAIRFNLLPCYLVLHWGENLEELNYELAQEVRACLTETMLFQIEVYAGADLDLPLPRIWITDPICPYHKDMELDEYIRLSLKDFLCFLKLLQTSESTFLSRIQILPPKKSPVKKILLKKPSKK